MIGVIDGWDGISSFGAFQTVPNHPPPPSLLCTFITVAPVHHCAFWKDYGACSQVLHMYGHLQLINQIAIAYISIKRNFLGLFKGLEDLCHYKYTGVGVGMQPAGMAKGGGSSSWRKEDECCWLTVLLIIQFKN